MAWPAPGCLGESVQHSCPSTGKWAGRWQVGGYRLLEVLSWPQCRGWGVGSGGCLLGGRGDRRQTGLQWDAPRFRLGLPFPANDRCHGVRPETWPGCRLLRPRVLSIGCAPASPERGERNKEARAAVCCRGLRPPRSGGGGGWRVPNSPHSCSPSRPPSEPPGDNLGLSRDPSEGCEPLPTFPPQRWCGCGPCFPPDTSHLR